MTHPEESPARMQAGSLVMKPGAAATLGEAAAAPGAVLRLPGGFRVPPRQPEAFAVITGTPALWFSARWKRCGGRRGPGARPRQRSVALPSAVRVAGRAQRPCQRSRWAVSLKPRTNHRSGVTTSCEIDALSAVMNANGRDPLACASSSPITPPWVNTARR